MVLTEQEAKIERVNLIQAPGETNKQQTPQNKQTKNPNPTKHKKTN